MAKEDLSLWKARINRAQAYQSKKHKEWKDSVDLLNCVFFKKSTAGADLERVDVNFANWYITNLVYMLYFRDPFIFIKARHSKYDSFADTLEKVINYYWKEIGLKQEFKRVILSALLMPPGWIKLGYTAEIGQDTAKLEEIKQKSLIQDIKDTITGMFKPEKEEKTSEEQGILNEYIKEESIFATWIPSWNMLIPEGYQLVKDMPWLAEIEDIPLIDFMANPLYKNKNLSRPTRTTEYESGDNIRKVTYDKMGVYGTPDDDSSIIRLYHIWDKRTHKRLTISNESNDYHFQSDWSYDMDGFPYKPLIFEESIPNLDESNPYPPNVLTPIMPQLIEISNARTQMAKHRRRSSAIILAQEGLATDEDMGKLEETDQVQLCKVSNIGAFQMTQTPPIPQEVFQIDKVIQQDLQMATNMGQMMFAPQPGQRTATQAQMGQAGMQLKAGGRVDVVEDFTVVVAKGLSQLIWQFYDIEKISEIIGEEANENMWLKLPEDKKERRKIIQQELQFRIDAGSIAPPKDETVDKKQVLDMASIVMTIAPERINKGEFVKQLLKKFKFTKELDKVVITDDEEEHKIAQQENQFMLQGMAQIVHPNDNHEIHIQEHSQAQGNMLIDKHIIEHGQRLGIKEGRDISGGGQSGVSGAPQKGDLRPPMKSTNPETVRQAVPEQGGLFQSAQNLGAGSVSPK